MSDVLLAAAARVLAASPSPTPSPSGSFPVGHAKILNDDTVSPGWLGFVVFLALAAGTVLLLRSFRRQLAKVPPRFDDPDVPPDPSLDERPASP